MKPYVKPELFYESFEMNQSIAACRWDMNLKEGTDCTAGYDHDLDNSTSTQDGLFGRLFTDVNDACTNKGAYEAYCYQNGAQDIRLLQS